MQIRVVLAKDGTEGEVRESISSYVRMLAFGFYEELPVSNTEISPKDRVRAVLGFTRTFIVALIPFSCLVLTRQIGLALPADFTAWAVVVTLAWAAITLVSAIDPLYKSRFQDVRDLMTAVRGKDG
jgi:hypothetical protein